MKVKIRMAFLMLFLVFSCPARARADRMCNYTNDIIWQAHAQFIPEAQTWGVWGWWSTEPGKCTGERRDDRYTYVAYERNGSVTPPRQYKSRPSKMFCVKTGSFEIYGADNPNECARIGGRMETFLNYGQDTEVISRSRGYVRMSFGFNKCPVRFGEAFKGVSESQMIDLATRANANGFTYHPELGYGKIMIGNYPQGCQSPADESWPLYLKQ